MYGAAILFPGHPYIESATALSNYWMHQYSDTYLSLPEYAIFMKLISQLMRALNLIHRLYLNTVASLYQTMKKPIVDVEHSRGTEYDIIDQDKPLRSGCSFMPIINAFVMASNVTVHNKFHQIFHYHNQ